jgi:hypothetical protein
MFKVDAYWGFCSTEAIRRLARMELPWREIEECPTPDLSTERLQRDHGICYSAEMIRSLVALDVSTPPTVSAPPVLLSAGGPGRATTPSGERTSIGRRQKRACSHHRVGRQSQGGAVRPSQLTSRSTTAVRLPLHASSARIYESRRARTLPPSSLMRGTQPPRRRAGGRRGQLR